MVVDKKTHIEKNNIIGYVECVYDSTSLLKSLYFPQTQSLYLSFKRGGVYSYSNVDNQLYENFENAESQGKFFHKEIRNNDKYAYRREFQLNEYEIKEADKIVEEWKKSQEKN